MLATKLFTPAALAAAATLALGLTHGTAAAQSQAPSLLFVHGIVGTDLGGGFLPSLPINVQIGSICLRQTLSFGETVGPLPVPVGTLPITVSLANIAFPCTNAPLLTLKQSFSANTTLAIVAAETPSGPKLLPVGLTALNSVPAGQARALAVHAANAPAVDVTLTESGGRTTTIANLAPGGEGAVVAQPFTPYAVTVAPAGSTTPVAGPIGVSADNRALEALFVVGSAADNTVTVIRKAIDGFFVPAAAAQ